ncbi:MAG: 8-amino-7-oxononanoate synthase [Bacteroidetes bacterium]|nr:8-amino-7-oxononanoate synthase [Bacteroidota bacterium]MBV6459982.1 8-amino-7-oxononanoate synthase 2 [Flavobacteriales bacterium]WKZ76375.1 MAG: 8-amino-7-oxononanoate synthase [Vicingaceae bacterium]MCL4816295.1 8-amino-7-oxononanoate synthase [Flavobacteriales bacterium]NOG95377.1 8-amino-7-oxononanoate synthase [Bacteroidota bacterium]
MNTLDEYIRAAIQERKLQNTYRSLSVNPLLTDFASNDYLGFTRNKSIHSFEHESPVQSIGGGGSRLITGNTFEYEELEKKIARFHKAEASLIFNTGYMANVGLLQAIAQRGDTIVYDELCHASIRDGIRLSFANAFAFAHNNLKGLEKKLKVAKGKISVVTESVYSMDGDVAPLLEIVKLCEKFRASLIVDEAHATGIYGKNGEGLVVELGIEQKVFARVVTFGKALGCHGATVLGSQHLIGFLVNFSRPFIYTTALPHTSIIAIDRAYSELMASKNKINELHQKIHYFKSLTQNISEKIIPSTSPIQALIIGHIEKTKQIAKRIREQGFLVKEILSPTVPKGSERIRICIHVFNTENEILELANILNNELTLSEIVVHA